MCPRIDELSRGGKDSGKNNHVPRLTGVHHVTVPTSDPLGTDWYVQVFGFTALLMEESESEVVAVLLQHPAVSVCCCGAPPRRSPLCADSRCSV